MVKTKMEYCPFCGAFEEYDVRPVDYEATVRGVKLSCVKHVATCKHCHEEIYVKELFDHDLLSSYEEYKKSTGLLTSARSGRFGNRTA